MSAIGKIGNFIVINGEKWINTNQISAVIPKEKKVEKVDKECNLLTETVPAGLDVYTCSNEPVHVPEEMKKEFFELLIKATKEKPQVKIDGAVSICTQMYNGEPTPIDVCLLKWCGDHYETK